MNESKLEPRLLEDRKNRNGPKRSHTRPQSIKYVPKNHVRSHSHPIPHKGSHYIRKSPFNPKPLNRRPVISSHKKTPVIRNGSNGLKKTQKLPYSHHSTNSKNFRNPNKLSKTKPHIKNISAMSKKKQIGSKSKSNSKVLHHKKIGKNK